MPDFSSPPGRYVDLGGDHTLMYTVVPPYGRKLYHFEKQRWNALD